MRRASLASIGSVELDHERKPRVLFLAKVYPYPPAVAGDTIYSRGVIGALSRISRLTVLCADSGAEPVETPQIDWCLVGPQRDGRAGSVLSCWPLIAWKGATASYHTALDRLLREHWDVVVLDNLGTVHALPKAMRYRSLNPGTRLVYVSHEHEYPTRRAKYDSYAMSWLKRLIATRDLEKVRKCEDSLLQQCDIVTVINTSDLAPFRRIAPARKYLPVTPGYDGPVRAERQITKATPRRVLVLGGRRSEQKRQILMDWLRVAYERLNTAEIEIVIVGDMEKGLRQTLHDAYPDVAVLGFVEDLCPLFDSARIGVIPDTVGGGFKLRLLAQVFLRLPIVGLRAAISGLPTDRSAGYLDAATLPALADVVCDRIDDLDCLNRLHNTAFADCSAAFSWQTRADALAAALAENPGAVLI